MKVSTIAKRKILLLFFTIVAAVWLGNAIRMNIRQTNNSLGNDKLPFERTAFVESELRKVQVNPWRSLKFLCGYKRFKTNEDFLTNELRKRSLPPGFVALPMAESYYLNATEPMNAGIWHLQTFGAKVNGLIITENKDERLDLEKSTNVALKLLSVYYGFFKDWRLAILAYYHGPSFVFQHIDQLHTKDPWIIEASVPDNDHYLARVIAAGVIMEYISENFGPDLQQWTQFICQ